MLLKDLKLRVFPQRFLTRSLIRRLPEDRRVLPHVADFVALGSLEELRVGFDRAQIRDGEILFADHWTSANRKQIDGKFLGMPSLIHRGERLIIPMTPTSMTFVSRRPTVSTPAMTLVPRSSIVM